jgi:hypothetical protein
MNIDEKLWPLPNAFNIREGSPFGRSEAVIKALKRSSDSTKRGINTAAKLNDPAQKRKTK